MTLDDVRRLMALPETSQVEFKAARNNMSRTDALKYLCAFSNEGGGHLILGVSNEHPRQIVGSQAFLDIDAQIHDWTETLGRHLEAVELYDDDGLFDSGKRVLVIGVERRPSGDWVTLNGVAWVRRGESLVPMPANRMRSFALESVDTSALPLPGTSLDDVSPQAIAAFRRGIVARAATDVATRRYGALSDEDLLRDLSLTEPDGTLTTAALLLVGRKATLDRRLAQAEVIFEKRRLPTSIRYEVRHTVREPLLLGLDEIVSTVMPYARLDPIEVQEGTRVVQLARYPERSVREAILNAVAHRDYTSDESVFVDFSDDSFVVTSPGAFPGDVTPENVAEKRVPRNRLLAESLEKCGLIERSGQGVDLMMLAAVRLAQPLPAFEEPEGRRVRVTLTGRSDPAFFEFTRQVDDEIWEGLNIEDFRTLDAVRRRAPTVPMNSGSVQRLLDLDLVQQTTSGHLRPSDRWLQTMEPDDQRQVTIEGLKDRIVEVLERNEPAGLGMKEIEGRFPDQTRKQLRKLLNSMRGDRVELRGGGGGRRWHIAWDPSNPLQASPKSSL